jgi:hypothetical protein
MARWFQRARPGDRKVAAIAIGSILNWGVGLVVAIVTAGITALAYSQTVPTHLRSGEFVTASVCFGVLSVGIAIGSAAVRSRAPEREAIEEHIAEESRFNQQATMTRDTVTMLCDNGITINDSHRPRSRSPTSARTARQRKWKTTEMVPPLEVPRGGEPATVWYDPSTGEAIANLGD